MMKANRLMILLAVMVLLAAARFAFPPKAKEYVTADPVIRKQEARVPALAPAQASTKERPAPDEGDVPGNAFAVRVIAAPAPVAPAPPMPVPMAAAPVQAVALAEPSVPPPPPLQVIGTYDDGGAPAVFLATPMGTLIARPGSVLMAEYRVTGITSQHVALIQVSTQRTFQLPLPGSTVR